MEEQERDRDDGKRQMFRISFLKEEHRDALTILNKCPKTLRAELVAASIVYYEKQLLRRHAVEKDQSNPGVDNLPVSAQAESKQSLTDIFSKVSI